MVVFGNYKTIGDYELACKNDPSVAAVSMEIAARALGVTIAAIEDMIANESLSAVKIADQTLVSAAIVEKYGKARRQVCESRRALLNVAHVTLIINYESLLAALAPLGDHKDDPELMSRVTELVLDYADLHCGHSSPAPSHQIAPIIERLQKRSKANEANHHR